MNKLMKKSIFLIFCITFCLNFIYMFDIFSPFSINTPNTRSAEITPKMASTVIYDEDFNDGVANDWTVVEGEWDVSSGRYHGYTGDEDIDARTYYSSQKFSDFIYEGDLLLLEGNQVTLPFLIQNISEGRDNGYYYQIVHFPDTSIEENIRLGHVTNGHNWIISESHTFTYNEWYHFKIEVNNKYLKYFLDDSLIFTYTGLEYETGYVGLKVIFSETQAYFDNLEISQPDELPVKDLNEKITTEYNMDVKNEKCLILEENKSNWINGGNVDKSNVGEKSFSISTWFKRSDTNTSTPDYIVSKGKKLDQDEYLSLYIDARGFITFSFYSDDLVSNQNITTNKWYHLCATYNISSEDQRLYLNGVIIGEREARRPLKSTTNASNWCIGKATLSNDQFLDGSLDDFRIWTTCLSHQEVRSVMLGSEDISKTSLAIWYDFEGNEDNSFQNRANSNNDGVGGSSSFLRRGSSFIIDSSLINNWQAIQFEREETNTNGYIELYDLGKHSEFTISYWVYPFNLDHHFNLVSGLNGDDYEYGAGVYYHTKYSNDSLQFRLAGTVAKVPISKFTLNQWHLISMVYTGTYLKAYLDGNLEASIGKTGAYELGKQYIGTDPRHPGEKTYSFSGIIDDLYIFSEGLPMEDIKTLYKKGSLSKFPLNIYDFEEISIDRVRDLRGNNNGKLVNLAKTVRPLNFGLLSNINGPNWCDDDSPSYNGTSYNGDGYYNFNGKDDCISLIENPLTGVDNFTLSLWARIDPKVDHQVIIQHYKNRINNWQLYVIDVNKSSEKLEFSINNNGNYGIIAAAQKWKANWICDNQWHFIIISWSIGNAGKIYIDGKDVTTESSSDISKFYNDNGLTYLGRGCVPNHYHYVFNNFNGSIDEIKIFHIMLSYEEVKQLYGQKINSFNPTEISIDITGKSIFSNMNVQMILIFCIVVIVIVIILLTMFFVFNRLDFGSGKKIPKMVKSLVDSDKEGSSKNLPTVSKQKKISISKIEIGDTKINLNKDNYLKELRKKFKKYVLDPSVFEKVLQKHYYGLEPFLKSWIENANKEFISDSLIQKFLENFELYIEFTGKILNYMAINNRPPKKDETWELGVPINEMNLVLELINIDMVPNTFELLSREEIDHFEKISEKIILQEKDFNQYNLDALYKNYSLNFIEAKVLPHYINGMNNLEDIEDFLKEYDIINTIYGDINELNELATIFIQKDYDKIDRITLIDLAKTLKIGLLKTVKLLYILRHYKVIDIKDEKVSPLSQILTKALKYCQKHNTELNVDLLVKEMNIKFGSANKLLYLYEKDFQFPKDINKADLEKFDNLSKSFIRYIKEVNNNPTIDELMIELGFNIQEAKLIFEFIERISSEDLQENYDLVPEKTLELIDHLSCDLLKITSEDAMDLIELAFKLDKGLYSIKRSLNYIEWVEKKYNHDYFKTIDKSEKKTIETKIKTALDFISTKKMSLSFGCLIKEAEYRLSDSQKIIGLYNFIISQKNKINKTNEQYLEKIEKIARQIFKAKNEGVIRSYQPEEVLRLSIEDSNLEELWDANIFLQTEVAGIFKSKTTKVKTKVAKIDKTKVMDLKKRFESKERRGTKIGKGKQINLKKEKVDISYDKIKLGSVDEIDPLQNVELRRDYEYLGGLIRYRVPIKNNTGLVISEVDLSLKMNAQHVRVVDITPRPYKQGNRAIIPSMAPKQSESIDFLLEPMICGTIPIAPIATYINAYGNPASSNREPKKVITKCPMVIPSGEENLANVKNLFESDKMIREFRSFELKNDPWITFQIIRDVIRAWAGAESINPIIESEHPFIAEIFYFVISKEKDDTLGRPEQIILKVRINEEKNISLIYIGAERNPTINGVLTFVWEQVDKRYGENFGFKLKSLRCPECSAPLDYISNEVSKYMKCECCGEQFIRSSLV